MANIYNQEPQAYGHIKFITNFGELDIELFTKQCPKATRNFTQLCLDEHYKNTIFSRVEKDFIAIGGNRANRIDYDDDDNEEYFPDEFHSRLRFSRRGLLATANTQKNKNSSKFFFTLGSTPELQNKHTIFGRLIGDTIYNLVELNECQVDDDFIPCSERKITGVIVVENPYPELKARSHKPNYDSNIQADSSDSEVDNPLAGPKVQPTSKKLIYQDDDSNDDDDDDNSDSGRSPKQHNNSINNKLDNQPKNINNDILDKVSEYKSSVVAEENNDLILESERRNLIKCESSPKQLNDEDIKEEKLRQIRAQIEALREQIESQTETKTLKERLPNRSNDKSNQDDDTPVMQNSSTKDSETASYDRKKNKDREQETLLLVSNFRKKLKEASKEVTQSRRKDEKFNVNFDLDDDLEALDRVEGDEWLKHEFNPKESDERINKEEDWYIVDDPRKNRHNHHNYGRHDSRSSSKGSHHRSHSSSKNTR